MKATDLVVGREYAVGYRNAGKWGAKSVLLKRSVKPGYHLVRNLQTEETNEVTSRNIDCVWDTAWDQEWSEKQEAAKLSMGYQKIVQKISEQNWADAATLLETLNLVFPGAENDRGRHRIVSTGRGTLASDDGRQYQYIKYSVLLPVTEDTKAFFDDILRTKLLAPFTTSETLPDGAITSAAVAWRKSVIDSGSILGASNEISTLVAAIDKALASTHAEPVPSPSSGE